MTAHQAPPSQEEQKKSNRLPWILLFVSIAIAGVVSLFAFVLNSDGTVESSLTPDQILALQQRCFENDPPLFYDEMGACYSVDPSTLTDAEKESFRVAASAAVTSTTSTTVAGVAAPATPAAPTAPSAPAAPAAPSAPSAPAAPGASSTTTTTTHGNAATTSTTTTTMTQTAGPAPMIPADHSGRQTCYSCHNLANTSGAMLPANPDHSGFSDDRATCLSCHTEEPEAVVALTVANSEWVIRITPTAYEGVSCSSDPKPPQCSSTLNGAVSSRFEINAGVFSGSDKNSNLERTLTWSGTIAKANSNVKADLSNNSGIQSTLLFTSQETATECTITGKYSYTGGISGTYTMERNDFGC